MRRTRLASAAAQVTTLAATAVFAAGNAHADEGMWQPSQLPALTSTLKARGLALDPNTLTNLTSYPMDAIVSLGGCTASFVSPEGLVVTNHHCGYGALQYNSTPQKNLIAEGFLAHTQQEELPADPTQRVFVTEQISDVTPRVNEAVKPGMDGYARYMAIDRAKKQLVQGCEQPGYRCDVYTFSGGYSYRCRSASSAATSITGCGRATPAISAICARMLRRTAARHRIRRTTCRTSRSTG